VAWKLGRTAAENPEPFAKVWWATIVLAAVILLIGRITETFEVGHSAAVLAAAILTLFSWWLVQRWGLHHLYELVPAFFLAAGSAVVVSWLFPAPSGDENAR
jgi:hypothetical protein